MQFKLLNKKFQIRELTVHMKKDFRVLSSGSYLLLLFAIMLAFGFISAYSSSIDFSQTYNSENIPLSNNELTTLFNQTIYNYWDSTLFFWPIMMAVIASLLVSQEKDDGMFQYICTYQPKSYFIYFSKLSVLSIIIILLNIISIIIFQIVFYFVSGKYLPFINLIESCIYPMFALIILSQLCLLIGFISKKKNFALIITVGVILMLFASTTLLMSNGVKDVAHSGLITPDSNMDPNYFPIQYKIIIVLNPMFLQEGIISILNLSIDYNSGIFIEKYFQILSIDWYYGYIIISMFMYSVVSIYAIQKSIPKRRKNDDQQ
ncbi:MAG: ABC transporter permease [Lutibacter sp.]